MLKNRKPVTILNGFLGAGKTTLLKLILRGDHGLRIAVIVNEFGEDIDTHLVRNLNGLILATMDNGCICCTLSGNLGETLEKLAGQRDQFDHLVIETTGLADPQPIAQNFMVEGKVKEYFALNGIIVLVDAMNYNRQTSLQNGLWAGQVRVADVILINKMDLVKPEDALALQQIVRKLNPLAVIHQSHRAHINLQHILQRDPAIELVVEEHEDHSHCDHQHGHCDHDHSAPDPHHDITTLYTSVTLKEEGDLDPDQINDLLGDLLLTVGDKIDRIKGILCLRGRKGTLVIQGVGEQLEKSEGADWPDGQRRSKMVIIGKKGAINPAALISGFRDCLVPAS